MCRFPPGRVIAEAVQSKLDRVPLARSRRSARKEHGERLVGRFGRCRVAQAFEAARGRDPAFSGDKPEVATDGSGLGTPLVRDGHAERWLVRAGFVASAVALETTGRLDVANLDHDNIWLGVSTDLRLFGSLERQLTSGRC